MEGDVLALRDLGAVILWAGAFALASLAYYLAKAIAGPLDVSILGRHPFRGIQHAIEAAIVDPLDGLRKRSEAGVTRGLSGLVDSLAIWLGLAVLLGEGVKAALLYLWKHVLGPYVHAITDPIVSEARKAYAAAVDAIHAADRAYGRATGYTDRELAKAIKAVEAYAAAHARAAATEAERFADQAVGKLRTAENAAIAHALEVAAAAKAAGLAAAAAAATEAERVAAGALAEAEAVDRAAINAVRAIAIDVRDDLATIEGQLGATGLAALLAAIPALATLVHTIATEAGLDNPSCRAKHKEICGVDSSAWSDLLGLAALLGGAIGLRELVPPARAAVSEFADLVKAAS